MLARRTAEHGGAALIVDYGHVAVLVRRYPAGGARPQFASPLENPGEADLTAQVDFAAVAVWAQRQGAAAHGPVGQGDFLRFLGIEQRAARLKSKATPQQAAGIDAALDATDRGRIRWANCSR